jgi:hypothetical protein
MKTAKIEGRLSQLSLPKNNIFVKETVSCLSMLNIGEKRK